MSIQPAFSYPGGKTRAVRFLAEVMDTYFPDAEVLYSPFMGGASFERYCAEKLGMHVYANDAFLPLVAFWKALKQYPDALQAEIKTLRPVSKAEYASFMEELKKHPGLSNRHNLIHMGAVFRVAIGASFMATFGHYCAANGKRTTESINARLRKVDLTGFKSITNKDWSVFLRSHSSAGMAQRSLIYLDPPYYQKGDPLYGVGGTLNRGFNHEALKQALTHRKNWMLFYNDCPYIRQLYKGYTFIPVTTRWKHQSINFRNIKKSASAEVLILSIKTHKTSKTASKRPSKTSKTASKRLHTKTKRQR
jgi:DNA adenine methylase